MENKGHIIASTLRPATSADTFAVAYVNEIMGGHHSYSSLVERDNIPTERRKEGMTVYVSGNTFVLSGGTSNLNWIQTPTTIKSIGSGTTIFNGIDINGIGNFKSLIGNGIVINDNGKELTFSVSSVMADNISNAPYDYSVWSVDTFTGATRQALANKFNSIDNNISSISGGSLDGRYVNVTGDTMTGPLIITDIPSGNIGGYIGYTPVFDDFAISATTGNLILTGYDGLGSVIIRNDLYYENETGGNIQFILPTGVTFDFHQHFPAKDGTFAMLSDLTGITSSSNAFINNEAYSYASWSGDTVSGATRQAIANKINSIDTNINSISAYTLSLSSTTQNLLNLKLNINDFNSYSSNTLTKINNKLDTTGSTLQLSYNNSVIPQILTSTSNGAVTIKRGSVADSDNVLTVLNGSGDTVFEISGEGKLEIIGNNSPSEYYVTRYSSDNVTGGYIGKKSRGTLASPSAVLSGDTLAVIGGRGYGITGFSLTNKANISILTVENWSDTNQGTRISFNTTVSGTTNRVEAGSLNDIGFTSNSFIKNGGTSSQFLKADGSVDNNTYATISGGTNNAVLTSNINQFVDGIKSFNSLSANTLTAGTLTINGNLFSRLGNNYFNDLYILDADNTTDRLALNSTTQNILNLGSGYNSIFSVPLVSTSLSSTTISGITYYVSSGSSSNIALKQTIPNRLDLGTGFNVVFGPSFISTSFSGNTFSGDTYFINNTAGAYNIALDAATTTTLRIGSGFTSLRVPQTIFSTNGGSSTMTLQASTLTLTATGGVLANNGFSGAGTGLFIHYGVTGSFTKTPVSGATYVAYNASPTINQSGLSSGIMSMFNANPIVTSNVDLLIGFYGNVPSGNSRYNLYMSGTTPNVLVGQTTIGATSASTQSAILDLISTTSGLGLPSMTSAQRLAISSPRNGLMVYQSDSAVGVYSYINGAWGLLSSTGNTGNFITGIGSNGQIAFWSGATSQGGDAGFKWDNTNKAFLIGSTALFQTQSPAYIEVSANTFYHYNIKNTSSGTSAAAEYCLTVNNGSLNAGFSAFGINSSGFADTGYTINNPSSTYLLVNGGDLTIGTQTANNIIFHTNGTLSANKVGSIDSTGRWGIGNIISTALLDINSGTTSYASMRIRQTDINNIPLTANTGNILHTTNNSLIYVTGTGNTNTDTVRAKIPAYLYVQKSASTISNTASRINLITSGESTSNTIILPAGFLTSSKVIRIRAQGTIASTLSPNLTMDISLGNLVLTTSPNNVGVITGTNLWYIDAWIRCDSVGNAGTVYGAGNFTFFTVGNSSTMFNLVPNGGAGTTTTINTTVPNTITINATWGTASPSNVITMDSCFIEHI